MGTIVIPPYIINNKNTQPDNRIQLEIPDYSAEYEEWLKKKEIQQDKNTNETVIIIDIY